MQGVDCQTGGNTGQAYDFAKQNGIMTLANYPITSASSSQKGSCYGKSVSTGRLKSDDLQQGVSEQSIVDTVQNHGPMAVSVDAENWQFYDGGRTNGDPGCAPLTSSNCGRSLLEDACIMCRLR